LYKFLFISYNNPKIVKIIKFTKKYPNPIGKVNNNITTEYINATKRITLYSFLNLSFRVLCRTPLNTISVEKLPKLKRIVSNAINRKSASRIIEFCSSIVSFIPKKSRPLSDIKSIK